MGDDKRKEANYSIIDYVKDGVSTEETFNPSHAKSFSEEPFNEIDGMIMTQMSTFDLSDCGIGIGEGTMTIEQCYNHLSSNGKLSDEYSHILLEQLAKNDRYKDMVLSNYVTDPVKNGEDGFNITEYADREQFAAVTITFNNGKEDVHFMSFEPTDASIDGWNEDVQMLLAGRTQAQSDSVDYMNIVGRKLDGEIIGGGHSKGGNDFEYGYLFCDEEIRNRITKGYLYDSPGLDSSVIDRTNAYDDFLEVVDGTYYCPENSMIGMMLQQPDNATFVVTNEDGFDSHELYSWELSPTEYDFIEGEQEFVSKFVDEWLDTSVAMLTYEERELIYGIVSYIMYNSFIEEDDGLGTFKAFFTDEWLDDNGNFNEDKLVVMLQAAVALKYNKEEVAIILGKVVFAAGYAYVKVEYEDEFIKIAESFEKLLIKFFGVDYDDIKKFFDTAYQAYINIYNDFKQWYNKNWNRGYKYATNNPYVMLDTNKLYTYAQRLKNVNSRISNLDNRLDSLRWKVDLGDFFNLLYADMLTGESWRLNRCINYLQDTANDFVNLEVEIKKLFN